MAESAWLVHSAERPGGELELKFHLILNEACAKGKGQFQEDLNQNCPIRHLEKKKTMWPPAALMLNN